MRRLDRHKYLHKGMWNELLNKGDIERMSLIGVKCVLILVVGYAQKQKDH